MNQKDILIGKYIFGELKGEELEQFNKSLEKNPSLAEEVKFHKTVDNILSEDYRMKSSIDENERKDFEQILSSLKDESDDDFGSSDNEQTPIIIKLLPWASLMVVAAALLLIFFFPFQNRNAKIAGKAYVIPTYEVNATLSSDTKGFEQAFNDKNYSKAREIYKNERFKSLDLRFYMGICLYELREIDEAISNWELIKETTGNQNLKNKTNWYLALAYLQKGNKQEAINLLNEQNSNSVHFAKAQGLLYKLR